MAELDREVDALYAGAPSEFIAARAGEIYTSDVNTNTNSNSDAEAAAGIYGMRAIAAYLGSELRRQRTDGETSALVAA